MAHRPRASIISLFDPLSLSSVSDKENDLCERSFFHVHSSQTPGQRILRQRLIDVGDVTLDEPDIHDLMAMEDELEEINNNIIDNEDGDTLTWRDMAKAATPKWSGRHATAFTTPKASPTSRTPLAELSFKDQTTPMARKKSHREHILPMSSKNTSVESPPSSPLKADCFSIDKSRTTIRNSKILSVHASDIITPVIEISDTDSDTPAQTDTCAPEALTSSVCTLDLPASPENLIADSSLPLDTSSSSSQLSQSPGVLLCVPPSEVRLRPNASLPSNADNRLSVDLHSSFQLHLNSPDATFDLLNEKISFFSSNCESDSFLNTTDTSFGEEDLGPTSSTHLEPPKVTDAKLTRPNRVFIPTAESHAVEINHASVSSPITSTPSLNDHDFPHGPSPKNDKKSQSKSNMSSRQEKESIILSTPSSSNYPYLANPPPPVPGLKIVKRSRLLTRRLSTVSNTNPSSSSGASSSFTPRRASDAARVVLPLEREKSAASNPPSPPNSSSSVTKVSKAVPVPPTRRGALTSASNDISGDGPRRVLISEGPKLNNAKSSKGRGSADMSRPPVTANGPRRIAAVHSVTNSVEKVATAIKCAVSSQSNTGLRQPVKYGTVGPSSAIPKPVTRTASSRLPAPATGIRSRPGLADTFSGGTHARRVT